MQNERWFLRSKYSKKEITITKPMLIAGRQELADIVCRSPIVSRKQACFHFIEGILYVQDTQSVNGTYVNNLKVPIDELHPLKEHDKVSFGFDDLREVKETKYVYYVKKYPPTIQEVSNSCIILDCPEETNKETVPKKPLESPEVPSTAKPLESLEVPSAEKVNFGFDGSKEAKELQYAHNVNKIPPIMDSPKEIDKETVPEKPLESPEVPSADKVNFGFDDSKEAKELQYAHNVNKIPPIMDSPKEIDKETVPEKPPESPEVPAADENIINKNGYTNCDAIIISDDDDDDDYLPCSQFVRRDDTKNKNCNEIFSESIFANMKKEIEEMECGTSNSPRYEHCEEAEDGTCNSPVDCDQYENEEGIDKDTADLLNMLEGDDEELFNYDKCRNNTNNDNGNVDNNQKVKDPPHAHPMPMDVVTDAIFNTNNKCDNITNNENENINNNRNIEDPTHAYPMPMDVATDAIFNNNDKGDSDRINSKAKDKTILNSCPGANKELLELETQGNCSTTRNESDNDKLNLNNISNKILYIPVTRFYVKPPIIPPHNASKKRKQESKKTEPKKKILKLEHNSEVGKAAIDKVDRKAIIKSKLKAIADKEKDLKVATKKQKIVEIQPSSSKQIPSAPSKVKVSDTRGKYLTVPINKPSGLVKPKTIMKCPSLLKAVMPSTSYVERVPELPSVSSYVQKTANSNNSTSYLPTIYQDLNDIILQILSWNPNWFEERKLGLELPPINRSPLQPMTSSFQNYKEYYSIMKPLLMVDLWNCLYSNYMDQADKKISFKCRLYTVIPRKTHMEFDCFCYIDKECYIKTSCLKDEDLVWVTFDLEKDGVKYKVNCLGFICNVATQIFDASSEVVLANSKIYAQVNCRIVLKSYSGVAVEWQIMNVTLFTSMVSSLRLFRSVKFLEKSALCKHILTPDINMYHKFHLQSKIKLTDSDDNQRKLLNSSQKEAIMAATKLCLGKTPGIYLIHGPPGTGKSTVIVQIICEILFAENNNKPHILIAASSNGAVDHLVKRLSEMRTQLKDEKKLKKVNLVRVGPAASIDHSVQGCSLPELAKKHFVAKCTPELRDAKVTKMISLCQKISEMEKEVLRNPKLKKDLFLLKDEQYQFCKKYKGRLYSSEYKRAEEKVLGGATVICTTLSSCINTRMENIYGRSKQRITCCIIDEATQSKEVESLIPLKLGIDKLVLVGDPKQLPAFVSSKQAKEYGYGISLFTRIYQNFEDNWDNPIKFLNMQYRMNPEICKFPNQTYYNGLLKNTAVVLERDHPICRHLVPYFVFEFGSNIICSQEYSNKSEIECVINLLEAIVTVLTSSFNISLGIITPYNNQRKAINEKLKEKNFNSNIHIVVNTVDSFQGQEKDIIIMSCVRLSTNNFLKDDQRLNVALTRAKHAMYIIGSEGLFTTCPVLGKLRDDAKSRNLLKHMSKSNVSTLTKIISL